MKVEFRVNTRPEVRERLESLTKDWIPWDETYPMFGYVPNYPPPLEGNENKLY